MAYGTLPNIANAGHEPTPDERAERGSWVGCIAGALSYSEYRQLLEEAGFVDITIDATHQATAGMDSAIIKATKPSMT